SGSNEEPGGGSLGDRALAAVEADGELVGRRLRRTHDNLLPWHESLVVEPVQELAVVFGQTDDRCARPRFQRCERLEECVLLLLERRIDRPAVRAAFRMAEL